MFAGAAFTDSADITVDADVVDTLVALGVIDGYEDGSFRPDVTVTRAEMAKMIYIIRTGRSDASAYNDDATTFTDITSHWARGYIKYCQSMGIIAGKSTTSFDPDATVTTQEAAKMLLVTLGYNAEKAGLEGSTWGQKTTALADENGLLKDVNCGTTQGMPREYAAQLIYNAIDAPTVEWRDDAYYNKNLLGVENDTIGEKYMGLKKTVGVMASFEKTDGKDTYEMTIDPVDTAESTDGEKAESNFKSIASDYSDLKYQTVKVLYKEDDVVYGVFATEDNTVKTGLLADLKMDGSKVELDGTSYSIASGDKVYVNDADTSTISAWLATYAEGAYGTTDAKFDKGASVKLLATDSTNKISALYVTTYELAKVTYVGSDYLSTDLRKLSSDDYAYASDIAKDDYVVVSGSKNADGKYPVEKAEIVEGKITSTKGSTDSVRIDGTWYDTATSAAGDTALKLGATVKLILVNGYIYKVDTVTSSTEDIALVLEVGNNSSVGSKYKQARILFADGTDKVVDIETNDADGAPVSDFKASTTVTPKLATFDVSKDVYTLNFITTGDTAGYDNYLEVTAPSIDGSLQGSFTGGVSKVYFDDAAVVFVQYDTDEYKIVSGTTARGWDYSSALNDKALALTNTTDGAEYASVAYVSFGTNKAPGGSDKTYAVALENGYSDKVDGTTYTIVKGWNGTETVEFKHEGTILGGISKGDLFEYSVDGEGVADISKIAGTTNEKVKSYDKGTGDITFDGVSGTYRITDDTVVLYVDSDSAEGIADGTIRLANKYNSVYEDDVANVTVYWDGSLDGSIKEVTVLVVDVNNDITQW